LPGLPGVLTFKEQGYPELQLNEVFAFFASSKTPKAVQRELEAAIVAAARSPRLVAAIEKLEFDSDVRSSADLARLLKEDLERWGPVIKATGYTADN
jgi:tripartite-type tricarboxylate transporter receptor subunit TctC